MAIVAARGDGGRGVDSGVKEGSPGGGSVEEGGAAVLESGRARNFAGRREASGRRRGRSQRWLREASGEAVASAAGA